MTMRVHKITTHSRAEEIYTLNDYLDMLRDALAEASEDEITALLREPEQHEVDLLDDGMDANDWLT